MLGHANDVLADELRAFARAVMWMLERAFPFEHCPAREIVLRQFGKDRAKIDLAVAERAEAPRALHPAAITAVHALPAVRPELRVLLMKRLDALVIYVDERKVVELLQNEMARVVEDIRARML